MFKCLEKLEDQKNFSLENLNNKNFNNNNNKIMNNKIIIIIILFLNIAWPSGALRKLSF